MKRIILPVLIVICAASFAVADGIPPLMKIDEYAVQGLSGTANSLAYKVHEIEKHFHSYECWFGAAVTPSGETNVADTINDSGTALQVDAGTSAWGAWTQIIGSSDTPCRTGMTKFDIHELLVTTTERASAVHLIQFAFGEVAATAKAAGDYTETVFLSGLAGERGGIIEFSSERHDAGTKVWMRVWIPGQATGTMDFFVGFHEYTN